MSRIEEVVTTTKSSKSTKAKVKLMEIVKLVNKELEKYFDKELESVFGVSKKEKELARHMLTHIKEHNLRPAKRLRASFVINGHKLLGGASDKNILPVAMGIELIHTALLMHDDFMDQDGIRRGLLTTHKYYSNYHKREGYRFDPEHYGNTMAVNAGDAALLLGYELISKSNFDPGLKIRALNNTLRGIVNTVFGQAFDVTLEASGKGTEQDVFDLHHAKTAIYTYQNPLHVGTILGGGKENDLELINKYAVPGGVAFQLQDDALGMFGDPVKTGKVANSDLKQGKMTLLILFALKNGNKTQVKRLKEIWGDENLDEKDANDARQIVIDTKSLEHSKKISIEWAKRAQLAIPKMREKRWNRKAIEYLDGIAQYMIEREL